MEIRNTLRHLTITMKSGGQCEKLAIWSTEEGRVENRETLTIIGCVGRYGRLLICICMQRHSYNAKKARLASDKGWWILGWHFGQSVQMDCLPSCNQSLLIWDSSILLHNTRRQMLTGKPIISNLVLDYRFCIHMPISSRWLITVDSGGDQEESANWLCDVSYTAMSM